jgi:hypothetical protein
MPGFSGGAARWIVAEFENASLVYTMSAFMVLCALAACVFLWY